MAIHAPEKFRLRDLNTDAALLDRLIGVDASKRYRQLRSEHGVQMDSERNAQLARKAGEISSRPPMRTIQLTHMDELTREDLVKRLTSARPNTGGHIIPAAHFHWPADRPLDLPECFFNHQSGFNEATPNPEYYNVNPPLSEQHYGATTNEAYADVASGKISLGLSGGNWFTASGHAFLSSVMPIHSPPNFPFPTDGITASGRVYDLSNIAHGQSEPVWVPGGSMEVTATIGCAIAAGDFDKHFTVRPGLFTSPSSGLISMTAYLNLSMSYITGGRIVQSITSSHKMIELAANSGPGPYGSAVNILTYTNDFLPAQNESQIITFSTKLPLSLPLPDQLLTEVEVELTGFRAGSNDPGAGYVAMSFQDWIPHTITPIYGVAFDDPTPFQVLEIDACASN